MMLDYLNMMSTHMLRHMESFVKDRVEVLHVLAACATAFYLWMRIDELFNMKHKDLELNMQHSDRKGYFYHKATIFRREMIRRGTNASLALMKCIVCHK